MPIPFHSTEHRLIDVYIQPEFNAEQQNDHIVKIVRAIQQKGSDSIAISSRFASFKRYC